MKLFTKIIVITLFLSLYACKKERVGGECEYIDIKKNVSISFIDGKLDSIFMISFQPVGTDTDEVYRMTNDQFNKVSKNIKLSDLLNKNNIYELTISEIKTGACVPFVIKKIHLQK